MPDRIERLLRDLRSSQRPLPPDVRMRIEAALLAETARPLEPGLHDRLADALTDPAVVLAGIDAPRALPGALHDALVSTLAGSTQPPIPSRSRGWAARRSLSVAAATMLVVASAAAISGALRQPPDQVATKPLALATTSTFGATASGLESASAAPATVVSRTARQTKGPTSSSSAALVAAARAAQRYGPPPPFAFPSVDLAAASVLAADSSGGAQPAPPTTRAAQSPVRIGVIEGDPAAEAGFRAYVHLLNDAGGAGGHPFALVTVDASHPANNVIATVNLSRGSVATASGPPPWAGAPLLETFTTIESVLRNDVFTFASAIERQAHLAADAIVPADSKGKRVVIYRMASGALGSEVPAAMSDVAEKHGATAVTVTYDGSPTSVVVPADIALLSLDAPTAAAWFREAKQTNNIPAGGVVGISTLFDSALLSDMPNGTRLISPYTVAVPNDEATALKANSNRPHSASLVHGWVAAKTLAVAVWERDASSTASMRTGLSDLQAEHFSSNWGPPYDVRPNTRSRTPEGVLLEVSGGAFVARGGFRKDPF